MLKKVEYIKDYARRTNLSQKDAKDVLESVYYHLIECLEKNNGVFTPIGKTEIKKIELWNQKYYKKNFQITCWIKKDSEYENKKN